VAESVAARYAVAAFAFMAAATWLGVGLTSGLTCLCVFVLAFQAVCLYQRRSGARSRRAGSRRERPFREEPASASDTDSRTPAASGSDRSRLSARFYDGDREEVGWPVANEAAW
jgi:hypothetical protein